MNVKEMRLLLGETQSEFAKRYNIPFRTIQNWETGDRTPPRYILELLERNVKEDFTNKKTLQLNEDDDHRIPLPERADYLGPVAWLAAVADCMGEPVVFALDEALMCSNLFLGRNHEDIIWLYGSNALSRFKGVAILGNEIDSDYVNERHGLMYTNFNRTLYDAISNEAVLDMQGITEALSKYYYSNNYSFDGVFVPPYMHSSFEELSQAAIEYYDY